MKIGINIKEILTNNLKSKIMKIFNIVFTTIHKQVGCLGPRYRQNIDKNLFNEMSVDLQLMI